jgi:hypothetical protein
MTEAQIQKLDIKLNNWRFNRNEWNDVKKLVELSTAKGHSDGKWQPDLSINYQVAYQKSAGDTKYHKSEVLNKEMHKLLSRDLHKYLDEAILNIKTRYEESMCINYTM